ncbi:response regulator, partial [Candidatus Phycosocius spiralis]|uniref:response regulator n=1 Tax=Candidatus Phycosocius spiralis TaxID=2815099 RepID=UPI0024E0CCA9
IENSIAKARLISQMIVNTGWVSLIALDLKTGLNLIANQSMELVISDLMLPDSKNGGAIAQIRAASPKVTIAATTSKGDPAIFSKLLERAKADGAEFILQKPFSQERLQELMDKVSSRLDLGNRRPHVLLIETSADLHAMCEIGLQTSNYRVSAQSNIEGALFGQDKLDLDAVIVEIDSGNIHSAALLEILRAEYPVAALIAISQRPKGGSSQRMWLKSLETVSATALNKPFTPAELVRAVNQGRALAAAALLEAANQAASSHI